MQIINEVKLDFNDVLIRPKRSNIGSRADVNLLRSFKTMNSNRAIRCLPIICANLDTTGTFRMCKVLSKYKALTSLHKFYSTDDICLFYKTPNNYSFYTTGITNNDINKLIDIVSARNLKLDKVCIDAANGYTKHFVKQVRIVRKYLPNSIILAGNVATPEMVQEILLEGQADIVKVGIGPGNLCETRKVTGCGYPQLSSIIECAEAAHGLGGLMRAVS